MIPFHAYLGFHQERTVVRVLEIVPSFGQHKIVIMNQSGNIEVVDEYQIQGMESDTDPLRQLTEELKEKGVL